ncbi:hypothetical protein N0V94_005297 [Neodidymelliopsis sp. IMI 364377]|nr:hypothetical protein N0V94_005297 [Neodidymelliopsis sp. IMI 364377]
MFFLIVLQIPVFFINACTAVNDIPTPAPIDHEALATLDSVDEVEKVHCNITTVNALKEALDRQLQSKTPRSYQLRLTQSAYEVFSTIFVQKLHQDVVDSTAQRNVCAGLLRQHCMLHLQIPDDLLEGVSINFRYLQKAGILIPGWEELQLGGEIKPLDPHEEPVYFRRFRLTIDFRILQEGGLLIPGFERFQIGEKIEPPGPHEEPIYGKARRLRASRHIDFAPSGTYVPVEFHHLPQQPIVWEPVGTVDLRAKIAFYQKCIDDTDTCFQDEDDVPEGPSYFEHHEFQEAYSFSVWSQTYKQNPAAMEEHLGQDPEYKQRVQQAQTVAYQYWPLHQEDFGRYFSQASVPVTSWGSEENTLESASPPPSNPWSPQVSSNPSYSSSSFSSDQNLTASTRRCSNDTRYSYEGEAAIWNDPAIVCAPVYRYRTPKYWSDIPGDGNLLAHECCISLEEFSAKNMAMATTNSGA